MNLFWVISDTEGDTKTITMNFCFLPSIEQLGELPLLGDVPPLKQTPLTLKPTANVEPNVSRLLAKTLKYCKHFPDFDGD